MNRVLIQVIGLIGLVGIILAFMEIAKFMDKQWIYWAFIFGLILYVSSKVYLNKPKEKSK